MTTIREYVEKNLGWRTPIGKYWHQCVDLVKHFLLDVFWKETWAIWNWKDTFSWILKYGFKTLDYNKSDEEKQPRLGDIISFWATRNNKYWHTWIVLGADEDGIYILEQNAWNWNGDGTWWNSITIRKKNYSNITWISRAKNILDILKNEKLDEVSFKTWIHIWEKSIKRKYILKPLFYFLAWSKSINWKNYKNLWITSNLENNTTRQELAYIILAFLNKILWKNLSLQDLQNNGIWNWQRVNDKVTGYEFTLMLNKTKEVYWL